MECWSIGTRSITPLLHCSTGPFASGDSTEIELPAYKCLHQCQRAVRLRPRISGETMRHPGKQLQLDVAAGGAIRLDKTMRYRQRHVVVIGALENQNRRQLGRVATLQNMLRISLFHRVLRAKVRFGRCTKSGVTDAFRVKVA